MYKQVEYQLLKNLQQSLLSIAKDLSQVRSLSPRDEGIVNANMGRIEGLAQGLDFFVESINPGHGEEKQFGFRLPANIVESDLNENEDPSEDD